MKINFTLWGTGVCGGVRVIFELANRLSERGHDVTITALCGDHKWFPLKAKVIYPKPNAFIYLDFISNKIDSAWMKKKFIEIIASITPECDINIATYCLTAYSVIKSGKGIPYYYIQHYEPMIFKNKELKKMAEETYNLPMRQIVVSKWLESEIRPYGKKPLHISNGVDNKIFYPRKNDKIPGSVMGIFNGVKWKGEEEMLDAIEHVSKNKNLKLIAAGNMKEFNKLLKGRGGFEIMRNHRPSDKKLAELYSSSEIFIFASELEGYGLPPLEAMACGTPSVVTDSKGVRDYAKNNYNCIMVKTRDSKSLAKALEKMATDDKLRKRLARNCISTAKKFNWKKSADMLEKDLKKSIKAH